MLLLAGCAEGDPQDPGGQADSGQADSPAEDETTAEDSTEQADTEVTEDSEEPKSTAEQSPESEAEPASEASWDPESIHVLVNRANPLDPIDFVPSDLAVADVPNEFGDPELREEPAETLEELFAAAEADGIQLWVTTTYRDFEFQQALYDQYVADQGEEAADRFSARPGYSEHQTGLAVDVADLEDRDCYLRACFGETEAGQWVAENAPEFGFIIRYPEGAEEIVGFQYEPWHLRYVGVETAVEVTEQGLTLEEYWDQPPAPDYLD